MPTRGPGYATGARNASAYDSEPALQPIIKPEKDIRCPEAAERSNFRAGTSPERVQRFPEYPLRPGVRSTSTTSGVLDSFRPSRLLHIIRYQTLVPATGACLKTIELER